jgi:PAS domain S-box-containing protein
MYRHAERRSHTRLLVKSKHERHNNLYQHDIIIGGIIQPISLTRFWHRRIAEAAFLMSAGIIVLYFLPTLITTPIVASLSVNKTILVLASLSAFISFVSYIWIPKKAILGISIAIYLLFAAAVSGLIVTTGGADSPFIALWMLVAIFSGIFGVYGLIPMLIGLGAFVGSAYLHGGLSVELIVVIGFAGLLPLIASFIIWHGRTIRGESDGSDRAYKDLATELSHVASQSEVVINAIGDGVIAVDPQGVIQLINPAAQRIIGWGKQDALALSYVSVLQMTNVKNEPLTAATDPVQQVLNTNQQVRDNNIVIVTKSGKKIMSSVVVSPIGDAGSGAIIVFRDITNEKAEEREQAEFISTASHEMRTPVASIEGYLGLALNPATAQIDDKARDFILKAHESAQHLGRLFQDLLDVSKAEDGRLSNNPKVIDVMAYTHDILQGLQQKATDKGLRLVFKPNPDDGGRHMVPVYNVNLDNDHIREVINNLTENAIKYTLVGEVIVDVVGTEDKVVISIKDSGIGIPAEDMPHLFQKFYRVDNVDTRQIGGTGLGLYLCRRLAETIGGRIWAESEYKKGSTFYFEIPRIDNQTAVRLSEQQAAAAAQATQTPVQPAQPTSFVPPVDTAPLIQPDISPTVPAPVQVATTVPRGESLSPEQIAAQVAKLQALARAQNALGPQPVYQAPASTEGRQPGVSIPVRDTPRLVQ